MIPYLSGLLIRNGLEGFGMLDSQGAPQPLVLGGGLNNLPCISFGFTAASWLALLF